MSENNSLQKDELGEEAKKYITLQEVVRKQLEMQGKYMRFDSGELFPATNNDNGRPIVTEDAEFEIIQPKQIENGTE